MMRTFLFALVGARFFQAPPPATVPVNAPAASNAVPYMAPVSYGFEQASAFPSAPVAAPVAIPGSSSSKSVALPLMAGAALGATVAVLFSSGKKSSAKPKAAAKKPVGKKPVAAPKAAPKRAPVSKPAPKARAPVAKAPVKRRSSDPFFNKTAGKGGIFPWIVTEPGTYAKPLNLSSIDFTSDAADDLIGWGAMPNSVKNIYNPKGRKGLFGGCVTPARK
jgi:hypothetical protein